MSQAGTIADVLAATAAAVELQGAAADATRNAAGIAALSAGGPPPPSSPPVTVAPGTADGGPDAG